MDTNREEILMKEVSHLTLTYSRKISELYQRMYGLNHEKSSKVYTYFSKHLQDFYEELLSSCESKMEEFEKEAEKKYLEYETLLKELNITEEFSFDGSEPLNTIIEKLDELLSGLKSIKDERVGRYNALLERQSHLCSILGEISLPSISNIPSEEQIKALQNLVENLEKEKCNRTSTFRTIKESIVNLMEEIEFNHTLPFHDEIVNSVDEGTFNLKTEYMERIKKFEEELKEEQQRAIKCLEYLKEKLNKLWDRIKVDEDYRSTFLRKIKGIGKTHQNMLKEELERCEEIKRINIKSVIEFVRSEIREIWDKLTYTQEQRMKFLGFISDSFSDELLTLHELELQKLETYYEENKHIYELAEKRESLWKRMQQLDEVASDKNRFKNRGGQLLKEEKERKLLENSLPRTDSQLKVFLTQYEQKTGKTFLWHGHDLLKKISEDWDNRLAVKDSKKLTKKKDNNVASGYNECIPTSGSKRKLQALSSENIQHRVAKRIPGKSPSKCARILKDQYPTGGDTSSESLGSYINFKEEINENLIPYSNKGNILKEFTPVKAAQSSPVKCKTPRTPGLRGNIRRF